MNGSDDQVRTGRIVFLTGAPGIGKTTLAGELATRSEKGVHIEGDRIRELVVGGRADPADPWTAEMSLQFELAHRAMGQLARTYSCAGFDVFIDHCTHAHWAKVTLEECPGALVVCLTLDLDENLKRNRQRANKSFNPTVLDAFIEVMSKTLVEEWAPLGGPVLNMSGIDLEEAIAKLKQIASLDRCQN